MLYIRVQGFARRRSMTVHTELVVLTDVSDGV